MKIYNSISETFGNTPLVKLNHMLPSDCATVLCKLEFYNPTSSIKDRTAVNIIDEAEKSGELKPGGMIIEATSGNTGVGLAMVAACRGYKLVITMPESMSAERRALMTQLGAEIELTSAAQGMAGAIAKAEELHKNNPGSIVAHQFENPANPAIHEQTTGPEILADTDGKVDIFVAAAGTGGTVTGVGRALKKHNSKIKIYAVEPDESAILNGEQPGPHLIQGIGAGFKPDVLDMSVIDKVLRVKGQDAITTARELAKTEGILGGISSGANVHAAIELAKRPENKGKTIVAIVCDTGERYLSTTLFSMNDI